MTELRVPDDIMFNDGPVTDAAALAAERGAASWLFLCGEEFAAMGGLSYEQVQAAVPVAANVISDPPRELTVELAERNLAALEDLPRPTLVTCRAGPRSSAVVYMYAGRKAGASADEVIARGEQDGASFAAQPELQDWVRRTLADPAPTT
jgi:hypothetical protein